MWGVQIPEKRQIWHERGRQATDRAEIDVCESHGRQERPGNLPAPFPGPWGAQGPKKTRDEFWALSGPNLRCGSARSAIYTGFEEP